MYPVDLNVMIVVLFQLVHYHVYLIEMHINGCPGL